MEMKVSGMPVRLKKKKKKKKGEKEGRRAGWVE